VTCLDVLAGVQAVFLVTLGCACAARWLTKSKE